MVKNKIREEMKKLLCKQSREEIKEKSKRIMEKLLTIEKFNKAKTIAFYLAKPTEVNLDYAIEKLIGKKEISVPVTNHEIELAKINSLGALAIGNFGIREPKNREFIDYVPEVVVIPGVAFDLQKMRLGYGKGYYDKFFKERSAYKIGIAFDFQIVKNIPCEKHDIAMDIVITEKRLL